MVRARRANNSAAWPHAHRFRRPITDRPRRAWLDDFGFRSPISIQFRRRPSRSFPSGGRAASTSCRCRRRSSELLVATADPLDVDCERTLALRDWPARSRSLWRTPTRSRERIDELYRGEGADARARVACSRSSICNERGRRRTADSRRGRRVVGHASRRRAARRRDRGARERHSHRAGRAGHRRSSSRRRRARARAHAAARGRPGARVAHQDSLRPRHRRSAASAGRTRARRHQRRRRRPARVDAARVARREGRDSRARRTIGRCSRSREWAFTPTSWSASSGCCSARRTDPRHRSDRLGQDDDALRGAAPAQGARREHRHGRRSDRVSIAGHRAGAGEREGRAHVRVRAAIDHAAGSRRRAHRRDSRPRDGGDRDSGVAHRAPRALDAPHQRRAERGHAADRHRRGELQDRDSGEGRARAAAGAARLCAVCSGAHDAACRRVRRDRISRAVGDRRGAHRVARVRASRRRRRDDRANRRSGAARWHAVALEVGNGSRGGRPNDAG